MSNPIDPIEAERQKRRVHEHAQSQAQPTEDPIARVRRELAEQRARLATRQHEHHFREGK